MDMYQERLVLREPYRLVRLWGRVALLAVLLWGGLITALSMNPQARPIEDFRASLRGGEVAYVLHSEGRALSDLRWSTAPLFWYRLETYQYDAGGAEGAYDRDDLAADLGAVKARPIVAEISSGSKGGQPIPYWPFHVPVFPGGWLVGAAWVITLLIMLSTARPRLGNRWAWFWLFTYGQAGAVLFLMSEPRPLWRGLDPEVPVVSRMGGRQGCLVSIGLGLVSILAVLAVSLLAHALITVATGG
ncbi:hypothetical protein GCM10022226_45120 [Sphaerisporangium flaviroseum]|uniref:DUF3592 domain-containing protein n=1 Tax=Sphaerisporangium flaviroseum TaxID=509199 RepID=A0ABP7IIW6_9ACTN